jgi:hypothetical protein
VDTVELKVEDGIDGILEWKGLSPTLYRNMRLEKGTVTYSRVLPS